MYKSVTHDGVEDVVAIEEPLEIRVDGAALAVTMRTPGHDEELALGFLYGEGLIDGPREAGLTEDLANNTIEVAGPLTRDPGVRRFYTTSSCGVCGKGALEEVAVLSAPVSAEPVIPRALAVELPSRLDQPGFRRTGGLHATGLFEADGVAHLHARGRGPPQRHGQGRRPRADGRAACPCRAGCMCVSGRLSFELVQKAAVAGAPILIGVGAPSSLAVELADDRGLTLCGFARRGTVNVYTHPQRIAD